MPIRTLLMPLMPIYMPVMPMIKFMQLRAVINDEPSFQFVNVGRTVLHGSGEDAWMYSGLEDDGD